MTNMRAELREEKLERDLERAAPFVAFAFEVIEWMATEGAKPLSPHAIYTAAESDDQTFQMKARELIAKTKERCDCEGERDEQYERMRAEAGHYMQHMLIGTLCKHPIDDIWKGVTAEDF